MADIELVIKIPEEVYNYIMRLEMCNMAEEYIKNGTLLPKRHGRLIDADSFVQEHPLAFVRDVINDTPTIIEAGAESGE